MPDKENRVGERHILEHAESLDTETRVADGREAGGFAAAIWFVAEQAGEVAGEVASQMIESIIGGLLDI